MQLHVHSSFPLMEVHYVVSTSVTLTDAVTLVMLDGFKKKLTLFSRVRTVLRTLAIIFPQQSNFSSRVPSACVKVKSRGQLVAAGTSAAAALTLLPEFSWAPRASVIVYCVRPSGEVVSDAAQLHVVHTLRNRVSRWSPASQ